jgi:hypothetical protein
MKLKKINDLIEVCKSPLSGLGIYARRNIPTNVILLKEEATLVAANDKEVYTRYNELSLEQKIEFDSLHWHWQRHKDPIIGRFRTNEFGARDRKGIRCGLVGLVISRFNHDCECSARAYSDIESRDETMTYYLTTKTPRETKRGEEITISYLNPEEDADRLLADYWFVCRCDKCRQNSVVKVWDNTD